MSENGFTKLAMDNREAMTPEADAWHCVQIVDPIVVVLGFEIQQPRLSLLIKIEHDDENDGAWLTLILQTIASANDLPGRLGIV